MDMKKNGLMAMLVILLCLAMANAMLHIQQQAWGDVLWALGIIMILFPLPDNVRFISAKLGKVQVKSTLVNSLHGIAGVLFVTGLLLKTL